MKKETLLTISQALAILRKKQPISELTLKKWCRDGLVNFEEEKHGIFKWKLFRRAEVNRVLGLLPKERINGLTVLPRNIK